MRIPEDKFDAVICEIMTAKVGLDKALNKHEVGKWGFFKDVEENPIRARAYAYAQQVRAEILADEVIEIADEEQDSQKARNRIDARKWYASKMQPQKYGDRIDLNVTNTVDLTAALAEAKRRVLPSRYPQDIEDAQIVETVQLPSPAQTGSQSVAEDKAPENGDADIFK